MLEKVTPCCTTSKVASAKGSASAAAVSKRAVGRSRRAAATRAQAAGKRALNNSIKLVAEHPDRIDFSVRGPGGIVEQLAFTLHWAAAGDGTTVVQTATGRYLTVRSRMFGIPYGQARVPALKSYPQFVEWMDRELSA